MVCKQDCPQASLISSAELSLFLFQPLALLMFLLFNDSLPSHVNDNKKYIR
jgi:hypothetical protein